MIQVEADPQQDAIAQYSCIVDLTCGAWRVRETARQIFEQLGLSASSFAEPPPQDTSNIALGVDNEAAGPLAIRNAYEDACLILANMGTKVSLLVLHGRDEIKDPLLFFLEKEGVKVVFSRSESHPYPREIPRLSTPERTLLSCFPGPLPEQVMQATGLTHPALFAHPAKRIIHPRLRENAPPKAARIATLFPYLELDTRIALIYHYYGPVAYADAEFLNKRAHVFCQNGDFQTGERLFQRARDIARAPVARAVFDLSLQGYRIFEHQFSQAAGYDLPAIKLPREIASKLELTKAWGCIFSGQAAEGLGLLEKHIGRIIAQDQCDHNDLFTLNIAALGRLRTGDFTGARALEDMIETRLDQEKAPNSAIRFINFINLSRLCKRENDQAGFHHYSTKAFAITRGLRNTSEMLQMNLIKAEYGYPAGISRFFALRAALIWLVMRPAESISIRAQQMLTHAPLSLEQKAAVLGQKLDVLLQAHWPQSDADAQQALFGFGLVEEGMGDEARAHGIDGISLIYDTCDAPPARSDLAMRVSSILRRCIPDLPVRGRILLDFETGDDLPKGREGLHNLCARHGFTSAQWQGETIDIKREIMVYPGYGVAAVSQEKVEFNKSRAPFSLDGFNHEIVNALAMDDPAKGILLKDLAAGLRHPYATLLARCRSLENEYILRLEMKDA